MVYDPTKPAPPPGEMATTSIPTQGLPTSQPRTPVGPPQFNPQWNSNNPWSPENHPLSQGSQAAMKMNPNLNLGPPASVATPQFNLPSGQGNGFSNGFNFGGFKDNLMSFIDDYRNSLFEWINGGRIGARPQLNVQSLLSSLFNPPAPSPAPAADPAPTV